MLWCWLTIKDYQSEVDVAWKQQEQKNKENLFAHIVIRSKTRDNLLALTGGGRTIDDVLSILIHSYMGGGKKNE